MIKLLFNGILLKKLIGNIGHQFMNTKKYLNKSLRNKMSQINLIQKINLKIKQTFNNLKILSHLII